MEDFARVSDEDAYCAFTDLKWHGGAFWLAYRVGKGHASPAGRIVVRRSVDGRRWERVAVLGRVGLDLRDPRLLVARDELYLLCFSLRHRRRPPHLEPGDSYFYRLEAGRTEGHAFVPAGTFPNAEHGHLLWGGFHHAGRFHATGYEFVDGHPRAGLWRASSPGGPWRLTSLLPDRELPPNAGFTELDPVLDEGGALTLFCRVDGDQASRVPGIRAKARAWAGVFARWAARRVRPVLGRHVDWFAVARADPPFVRWRTTFHRTYLKGPRAVRCGGGFVIVGRHVARPGAPRRVVMFTCSGDGSELHPRLHLATGRDGSYAGACWHPDDRSLLLVSFYSDHARLGTPSEGRVNDVWVARIRVPQTRPSASNHRTSSRSR